MKHCTCCRQRQSERGITDGLRSPGGGVRVPGRERVVAEPKLTDKDPGFTFSAPMRYSVAAACTMLIGNTATRTNRSVGPC